MKNKKGFTLVELLAVVTLIALLSILTVPSIFNLISRNETKISSTTQKLIFASAESYLDANQTNYKKLEGAVYCPTIQDLIDNGFMEPNLVDVETGEKFDSNIIIKSSYNGYKYEYEVTDNCQVVEVTTEEVHISIGTLIYKSNGIVKENVYTGTSAIIEVPITTINIADGEILQLRVRRGSSIVSSGFTVPNVSVSGGQAKFEVQFGTNVKSGEYVLEVTGGNASKATANLTVYEPYKDPILAGSIPDLLNKSLTPVIWNGENWIVADINEKWYDYSEQWWANAVILEEGVTKKVGDIVKVPSTPLSLSAIDDNTEVRAMYVWIPRYEYKIEGTYGTHMDGTAGTQELPGEIEVNFISASQTAADNGYILHQSFDWDGIPLAGVWVGKFETGGHKSTEKYVLPNIYSYTNQNVSDQFQTAQKFVDNLTNSTNVDAHMMKNSEWGAVTYLSQSRYGKYGNENYAGEHKEIYENNSYSSGTTYTGRSSGVPLSPFSSVYGDYNYAVDLSGTGASTTGNIYGIYDMNGGTNEYVMAYCDWKSTVWGSNWVVYSGQNSYKDYAGFSSAPASKYFDKFVPYSYTSSSSKCYAEQGSGQALEETLGWYSSSTEYPSNGSTWISRGGNAGTSHQGGIFAFHNANGEENNGYTSLGYTFRSVLIKE